MTAPGGPVLLLVDDRPSSFTRHAAATLPEHLVLLRFEELRADLSADHLRRTAHLPAFWVRADRPLEREAARYRDWAAQLPVAPSRFCNPSEPRQALAHRFAALAGLPHLSGQQVAWVRDKAAMKRRFRELGLCTAEFAPVRTAAEVNWFAARHGWPLVLKPVDSFACVDTHRLDGPWALDGIDLTARDWMVEQFLGGTEWEVCAIIHRGEVLDAWPSAMPCRPLDIVDGAMNANISVGTEEAPPVDLRALLQRIVTGMGIDHGYAHMEFFLIDGRLYAGEIGLRLAGCEIPANHGHAYGFDVFGATLDVYRDIRPRLSYRQRRCAGDLLLPLPGSGTVRRITPAEELLRVPGVVDAVLKVGVGDAVSARRASHNSSGYVHVVGASIEEVERRMREVLGAFTIELTPAIEPASTIEPPPAPAHRAATEGVR
ncbi:ATP-dependent carboxylate-amine ligase [Streptomyces sp. FH025]|uniref:ATP-grasp domain-containing protein n=1 Tax=Streptomyces sp. FH025 TaxID=2815937 RepID=UPI001A9F7753|nr:ATP-dependent carboxylate-amine ligase [Streptomyces sp. FH025]MBO1416859.1 ATP-dependent carboxylate-amine ligase [Streptomyces sp. FH025]